MKELFEDIKYYIDLRVQRVKLTVVEHLSTLFSKAIAFVLMILFALLALLTLTGALIAAMSVWLNSVIWAFLIVAALYIILAVIMFALREKMFAGTMVSMFSKMFFQEKGFDTDEDE